MIPCNVWLGVCGQGSERGVFRKFPFWGCSSLLDIKPLRRWKPFNGNDFKGMFFGCSPKKNLDPIKNWKVSEKKVQFIPVIVCYRENGGITWQQYDINLMERKRYLQQLMPPGIYDDYLTLSLLDKETLFKLFHLCKISKAKKLLTFAIKAIFRLI